MSKKKIIHFYEYLDYEDLLELGFEFETPVKNHNTGIYSAYLKKPIYFYTIKDKKVRAKFLRKNLIIENL